MPVTAILGPRQCGKTTLVRILAEENPEIIILDMENPDDLRVMEDLRFWPLIHLISQKVLESHAEI